jgi:hypothetical protein
VGKSQNKTLNFVSIAPSYNSNCKIIWAHNQLNHLHIISMIIMMQGDTLSFGAGPPNGDIFSARVVGAGDSEAASVFLAN